MNKWALVIFIFLSSGSLSGQTREARIDTIQGIIETHYKFVSFIYCEQQTVIIYNGDTIPFGRKIENNQSYIKKYPEFEKKLGKVGDYFNDDFNELALRNDTFNLKISIHDYHDQWYGHNTQSVSFYSKDDTRDVYAIYHFTGVVVIYTGIELYKQEEMPHYCLCPISNPKGNKAIALKRKIKLDFLTDEEVKRFHLRRSGIRAIDVLYCE